MPIDAVKDAVREAIEETGFQEPQQGRAQQPEPAAAAGGGGADDGGDDATPTAEQLESIDRDPKLKEIYRKMARGFHGSNEKLAARRREADEAQRVAQAIRQDPQGAARAIAAAAGVQLAGEPPKQTVLERTREKLRRAAGDEVADVLGPILHEVVSEIAGEAMAPVTGAIEQAQVAVQGQVLKAEISEFAQKVVADGEEWSEEIEAEMADLVPTIQPGPRTTLPEYLEVLHARVMGKRRRAAPRRRVADEPAPRIRVGMNNREAVRIAVESARRDVGRR
jgi:hypothetical protein